MVIQTLKWMIQLFFKHFVRISCFFRMNSFNYRLSLKQRFPDKYIVRLYVYHNLYHLHIHFLVRCLEEHVQLRQLIQDRRYHIYGGLMDRQYCRDTLKKKNIDCANREYTICISQWGYISHLNQSETNTPSIIYHIYFNTACLACISMDFQDNFRVATQLYFTLSLTVVNFYLDEANSALVLKHSFQSIYSCRPLVLATDVHRSSQGPTFHIYLNFTPALGTDSLTYSCI